MLRSSRMRRISGLFGRRPVAVAGLGLVGAILLLLIPAAVPAADEKPKAPPKPAAAPAKSPAKPAPAKPAVEESKKEAPLSFTDDDLEKFHKPKPVMDEESADEESLDDVEDADVTPAAPVAGTPGAAPAPNAKPAPARAAVKPAPRVNPVLGPPPTEDPLKKWKQEDALAGMRAQQIATLREKINGLKSRLDYLNTKKDGLLNPGPPQVAQTKGVEYPPTEPPDPNKPPPPPNRKPDISPGRTIQPVGLIFPSLPEPQTDADREADKTMKIKDLLEKVKEEIETVEADIKRAQDDLITIETRAAGETARP